MRRRFGTILCYVVIGFSLLMTACSSVPRIPESRFSQQLYTSRGGQLRFRIPDGWLNATNDSSASTNIIWLVRSDFAATISVKEIVLDAEARRDVDRSGLNRIADLTMALASNRGGVSIAKPPEPASLHGLVTCTYTFVRHQGDRVRVILIDTGRNVYEVSALTTEKVNQASIENAVAIQEAFVQNLVW